MQVPEGYTVRFVHYRKYKHPARAWYKFDAAPLEPTVDPLGGTTVALIRTGKPGEEQIVARGEARCHSKEHYNKKIGRQIALGRALKNLEKETT